MDQEFLSSALRTRFLTRQKRNQSLKFSSRIMGVFRIVSPSGVQVSAVTHPDSYIPFGTVHQKGKARVSTLAQKNESSVVKLESQRQRT